VSIPAETIRIAVAGMTCSSCVSRITRALKRLDGVSAVRIDLGREVVTVRREPTVSDAALAAAIGEAGYEAEIATAVVVPADEIRGLFGRITWVSAMRRRSGLLASFLHRPPST